MLKILIMGSLLLVGLFVIGFWQFGAYFMNDAEKAPFTLTVWSTKDEEQVFAAVVKEYQKSHPYANIQFVKQTPLNYRTRIQAQVAQGSGPDIFLLHESWMPMFLQTRTVAAMPAKEVTFDQFTAEFYPVIKETLSSGGKLYGAAPFIDGLILLVNDDLLKERNVEAPKTWDEFFTAAQKLNAIDDDGTLKISGAAIGTATNVDYWSDLVGLLFLQQPETNLANPSTEKGADVLRFYTQFANSQQRFDSTWDDTQENSSKAFAAGRVAMVVSTYEKAQEIKASNQNLKFRAVPMPQLPTKSVTWGSFWSYGVSNGSPQKSRAWEFLKFLMSDQGEKAFNQAIKQRYGYYMPYSRLDLQKDQVNEPLLGAVVTQGPLMKSWYLAYGTNDQGLNDSMIKAYKGAVDTTLANKDPQVALATATQLIQQALSEYTTPLPPAK
jgi:multiple sugar transport system substrate-binding protein